MTSSEYYQKNKERILQKTKEHYSANKEKYLEYQRVYRNKNRIALTLKGKLKRQERLQEYIQLLGGKCSKCGGVFDNVCYDFHHKDPTTKEFTIGEHMGIAADKLLSEVNKCILLCANCHRLEHKHGT